MLLIMLITVGRTDLLKANPQSLGGKSNEIVPFFSAEVVIAHLIDLNENADL